MASDPMLTANDSRFTNPNMTVDEMASFLCLGKTAAYRLANDPDFPAAFHHGRKIIINRERLIEWNNQQVEIFNAEKKRTKSKTARWLNG